MKKYPMIALMTLSATATRGKVERGAAFEATEQERRDLIQFGRAEDQPDKAKAKSET
ncbi:MAG: hypothetical protein HOY44_07425 [Maritimibacter sp.]|uniref:hypothetical protein n=1 Tax=Maritimibacter sp. TaxID=2003363 RepID=UPI001DCD07BF|nr:hypothetical protein [Maritimibacter sp.]MBL6427342.1 hypothetical protein [Maritimibacter sp.]